METIQRGNFTPAYEQGSAQRDAHRLETARCYTMESIHSKADQGWNESKLALKNWIGAYKQMKEIFKEQKVS